MTPFRGAASVFGRGLFLLIVTLSPNMPAQTDILDLSGAWTFKQVGVRRSEWRPAVVPGSVHLDLLRAGRIDDPFDKRNEFRVQWIEGRRWVYRREFQAPASWLERRRVDLVCDGLDTLATIRLNGHVVGEADNMFRRWTFPLRERLQEGDNALEIEFDSIPRRIAAMGSEELADVPAANDPVGGSPLFRKAPYQFGWDWGPRLVGCGVWRPLRIVATNDPTIEYATTRQTFQGDDVRLDVSVEVRSPRRVAATLRCEIAGKPHERRVDIPEGLSAHTIACHVSAPERWWPSGHGEPRLYRLDVALEPEEGETARATRRVGFRTLDLVATPDSEGVSFTFRVNGKPVFCKGANWIPCDSFPSRVPDAVYRARLEDAAAVNMNMIRVWGGGIYEDDRFYELCDELGIMVWQDFMFACSLYPADDAFLANVRAEAEHNIKRLMTHPSIVLYCGNNECEQGVRRWWRATRERWRNYRKLYHELLPEVCEALDPDRPYWPSSPHSLRNSDPSLPTDGDTHVWDVWHGSKPFEHYETIEARFVSEFGFQSFPPIETIRSYADPEDMNLTAPEIEHHQKNRGGNARILIQMTDRFRMPFGFHHLVTLSQLQQGLAIQTGAEHWRRRAPICMGLLYWQLNDCWPVASWSSIDYYGRWKALHYFARRFYAPLAVSSVDAKDGVEVWAAYDHLDSEEIAFTWRLLTYDGDELSSETRLFSLRGVGGIHLLTVPTDDYLVSPDLKRRVYLSLRVDGERYDSRNVHHFAPFKDLELPRPTLAVDTVADGDRGATVTIATDTFAKWVSLEAEGGKGEGRFSDNYFDMDPGETRVVRYDGAVPGRVVARSLADTYWADRRGLPPQ